MRLLKVLWNPLTVRQSLHFQSSKDKFLQRTLLTSNIVFLNKCMTSIVYM